MKQTNIFLIASLVALSSCVQEPKKAASDSQEVEEITNVNYFIESPLPNSSVPFSKYSVDAAKGDTLFHTSGSIILFPESSFVDKNGDLIEGNVDIEYREFSNPMDFYLAGIPLEYDSLGTTYSFESSGMCELLAYQDEKPVFVNPSSKPEINMVSQNTSKSHSIYYLDTVKKNWINREMSVVTDLRDKSLADKRQALISKNNVVEPLKPEKATDKTPIIEIDIGPTSYKELLIYDNLKFQLEPNELTFNPKDANEIWSTVELVKKKSKGLYTIHFKNATRSVSYAARPVLEGEDYSKALTVFEKKNALYKRVKNRRLKEEDSLRKENERIERLNDLIALRDQKIAAKTRKKNALIRAKNKKINEENVRLQKSYDEKIKEIENQNAVNRELNQKIQDQLKAVSLENQRINKEKIQDQNKSNEIIRNFSVDRFGIWNCDKAYDFDTQPILATFKDNKGNTLDLSNLAVVYKSFNGLQRYYTNQIRLSKDRANMIFAVNDGQLAYFSYADFENSNITQETISYTFVMKTVPEKNSNYEFLKGLSKE